MSEELEFKISSGLKNLIGKELIVTDNIAIFELVKNAYDAYAKEVEIEFLNVTEENRHKGSKIIIYDNGHGMSHTDIVEKWLFVGYSEKKNTTEKDYRDKIQEKRIFAGAKGIGRFSSDRLGKKLRMFTKKQNEKFIHLVSLEWNKFEEDQEKEFQKIHVEYSEIKHVDIEGFPYDSFECGTILEISNLNDIWDKPKILKLKRYMQRLINPATIKLKNQKSSDDIRIDKSEEKLEEEIPEIRITLIAPEFKNEDGLAKHDYEIVNGPVENIVFEKLHIRTTEITCSIDEKGEKLVTRLVDKGVYIFELKEKNIFPLLKGINVKIFYLNQEAKRTFSLTMGIPPVRYGSVFLYKNRFRIHPLGDEGNDWLGLEKRKTQGYRRFLSERELMGRIEIIGSQPEFKEVTNREGGLIKNEHSLELIKFIQKIPLRRLERYVVEALNWDTSPKNPDDLKQDILKLIDELAGKVKDDDNEKEIDFNPDLLDIYKSKQIEKIPQLLENLEKDSQFIPDKKNRDAVKKEINSLKTAYKASEAKKDAIEKELVATQKTSIFLEKAVSTDKEVLINLNHSIKITTFIIEKIIKEINEEIKAKKMPAIIPLIDELNLENQKIRVLSSYVSFANFDTKVEVIKTDIVLYIQEYLEKITTRGRNISLFINNPQVEFIRKFRPLEVSIILDNLFDNSRKAGASKVTIKFRKVDNKLHILFSDDGKGIENSAQKFLFSRGFTLTDGSGIGLYHVKKLLESTNAEIRFVGNSIKDLEKGACFEVIFK